MFDKGEMLECIRKLVEIDQEWVPYSQDTSLYIRPTFVGTEVSSGVIKQNAGVQRNFDSYCSLTPG